MIGHPSDRSLIAYVDGDLSSAGKSRLKKHLAGCVRCRTYILTVKRCLESAKVVPDLQPPDGALESILERRGAGERVLLPTSNPSPTGIRGFTRFLATAVTVVLVVAVSLFWRNDARSDQSSLLFSPAAPERGDTVHVVYRSHTKLGSEDRLMLRARFRRPHDPSYDWGERQVVAAELLPTGDGVFSGSFVLPDSVVYGAFAVEDRSGELIDSNGKRLWDLLVYSSDIPELCALMQRVHDLSGRDWEGAFTTAVNIADLYPEDPWALVYAANFELQLSGALRADSINDVHVRRFARIDSALFDRQEITEDEISGMFWLARTVFSEGEAVDRWKSRLLSVAPHHQIGVLQRAIDIKYSDLSPASRLSALERLWQDADSDNHHLAEFGLSVAIDLGTPSTIQLWLERADSMMPWRAHERSMSILEAPGAIELGLERLWHDLASWSNPSDDTRELYQTTTMFAAASRESFRSMQADVGKALVLAGRVSEGIPLLDSAVSDGWDPSVIRAVAEARLAEGDSVGAANMYARLVADPTTPLRLSDSLCGLGLAFLGNEEWNTTVDRSRSLMNELTVAESKARTIDLAIPLLTSNGDTVSLDQLLEGKVAVVAFWSRFSAPSFQELGNFHGLAARLSERGVPFLAITTEAPSTGLMQFAAERAIDSLVYHDSEGKAALSFNSASTPDYFVVDSRGIVRFETSSHEFIERYTAALQDRSPSRVLE